MQGNLVTLITTRSSGSSYLNRVKLQNGCLTRAHSNLYIPSTLHGSPISSEIGNIDKGILCKNLSSVIDIYIERCDGAPCGRTNIHLYKGAMCQKTKREKLLVFLKSPKKEQQKLKQADPNLYQHFKKVWGVRKRHMVAGLPPQYIFSFGVATNRNVATHSARISLIKRFVGILVVLQLIFSHSL